MPSPLVKENLKATNLAMTSVVPSTSAPFALVRHTYCPTIDTGRNTTAQARGLQPRLQNWHRFSHDAGLV